MRPYPLPASAVVLQLPCNLSSSSIPATDTFKIDRFGPTNSASLSKGDTGMSVTKYCTLPKTTQGLKWSRQRQTLKCVKAISSD